MGGEPTFVSVDDMTSPSGPSPPTARTSAGWPTTWPPALAADFAPGGLIQRSQGKWYPGEPLPRWQIGLIWRTDGEPLWTDQTLFADPYDADQADRRPRRARRRPPSVSPAG